MEPTLPRAFICALPEESVEIEHIKNILLDREMRVYKYTHLRTAKLRLQEIEYAVVVLLPGVEHKVVKWLLKDMPYKPYIIRVDEDTKTYDTFAALVNEQVSNISLSTHRLISH
jgi:hypothetical protein